MLAPVTAETLWSSLPVDDAALRRLAYVKRAVASTLMRIHIVWWYVSRLMVRLFIHLPFLFYQSVHSRCQKLIKSISVLVSEVISHQPASCCYLRNPDGLRLQLICCSESCWNTLVRAIGCWQGLWSEETCAKEQLVHDAEAKTRLKMSIKTWEQHQKWVWLWWLEVRAVGLTCLIGST